MFITFEGIEGSGKSTQAKLLKEFLELKGQTVTLTREPGWGAMGKLIRRMLLEERIMELDPMAELCLFCADRAQHVKDFILPKLKQGEIVICDRFYDSTIVYQGYARRLDLSLVKKLAKASALDVDPGLTFLLNIPVRKGLSRLQQRDEKTKLDEEPIDFHERVRQGYMLIAKNDPTRVKILNAAKDISVLQDEIRSMVLGALNVA
ncbi:dTMP kinase [Desulfobacterota bacterium AH_259_B03_O07]|nr:dTMP kinase [Desulfobacterota bacterium AH_259_B03_O07]